MNEAAIQVLVVTGLILPVIMILGAKWVVDAQTLDFETQVDADKDIDSTVTTPVMKAAKPTAVKAALSKPHARTVAAKKEPYRLVWVNGWKQPRIEIDGVIVGRAKRSLCYF